jgi:uncharacterized protein (TIGR02186 family)
MKFALIAITALFVCLPLAQAQQRNLQIELASDHVDITTGFNGTQVILFGTTDGNGDVVILLKGPENTVIVRRKNRVFGAWMNRTSMEFRRVPSYYDYASTLPDGVLRDYPDLLREGQIGVDNLGFYPEDADEDGQVIDMFEDSLIRQMQRKGFYPIKAGNLQFLHPGFFKASFQLPPGVPTGTYTVEGLLVENGKIVAREAQTLRVGQVGFNARVYSFSDNHSFLYGLFAILMALMAGWSAFTFLRRD